MQRIIAITGATGFLGKELVSHFSRKGDKVLALVRSIPQEKVAGVEYFIFDLSSAAASTEKFQADVLIHTAYIAVTDSKNPFEENLSGARRLIAAFPSTTKKIFISSVSADPDSPAVYGKQKAAVEKLFLDHSGAAIRPGLILGNGGMFANMRDYLKKKRNIPVFNGGTQPLQTVFVNDLVRAIDELISKDLTGVFTFCENDPVHYREFYSELCRQLKVKPRFISIPFWVAGCMVTCANAIGITLPVNHDNLQGLKLMKAHRSKEDAERIGVIPGNYRDNLSNAMRE